MKIIPPLGARRKNPFIFRTFFEMGFEESASPFLNTIARSISRNLPLKASCLAAIFLFISYLCTYGSGGAGFVSHTLLGSVYLIAGVPLLIDSVEDVVLRRDINIDLLMTLAAFSSFLLGAGYEGGLLLVLFAFSGALEDVVTLKAKKALSSLAHLTPTRAYICDDSGNLIERAVEDVTAGQEVFVRAGEMVPLDGIVIEGASSINIGHITGESRPIRKIVGDEVPAGAYVNEGSLKIRVTCSAADSTIAKIIELITKAQSSRPTLERWFDRFGRYYASLIILFSILSALFFAHVLDLPYFGKEGALYRSLAFLITASPCALILAVPIAYLSALGACAKNGVILKGGIVFDQLNQCNMVAFDKTGTLTRGELSFVSLDPIQAAGYSETDVLCAALSLERHAVHPIAKAVGHLGQMRSLSPLPTRDVRVIAGVGIEGQVTIAGRAVQAFIGDASQKLQNVSEEIGNKWRALLRQKEEAGFTVALLTLGDALFLFSFEDEPREGTSELIQRLRSNGRESIMLTGDNKSSAARIAALVGITTYYAELKPEDKLQKIEELSHCSGLAMVGDGINDAPALARSTVGIAMGNIGSKTTQSVADCILLHDTIDVLDWLFQKAAATKKVVIQNLSLALSAIVFASGFALYGLVPLWLAVILHEGGTVLVGLNAVRLLRR